MSRKFERQVERNAKRVNAQRKRFGQTTISDTAQKKPDHKHQGRSILLPAFLLMVGLTYLISFWNIDRGGLYWVTVISYVVLALVVFGLRRPFLTIDKNALTTRKFAGFRSVNAEDIEEIEAQDGYIIIVLKSKKPRWVFSRSMNRFDTATMAVKLKEFAKTNQVKFKEQ
jgi:hypothetical protein